MKRGHVILRPDPPGPLLAARAPINAPLPIAFARTVIFDSALTFFMVLALCAFYLAVEARAARRRPASAGVFLTGRKAEAADLLPAAVWARPPQFSSGSGETLAQT